MKGPASIIALLLTTSIVLGQQLCVPTNQSIELKFSSEAWWLQKFTVSNLPGGNYVWVGRTQTPSIWLPMKASQQPDTLTDEFIDVEIVCQHWGGLNLGWQANSFCSSDQTIVDGFVQIVLRYEDGGSGKKDMDCNDAVIELRYPANEVGILACSKPTIDAQEIDRRYSPTEDSDSIIEVIGLVTELGVKVTSDEGWQQSISVVPYRSAFEETLNIESSTQILPDEWMPERFDYVLLRYLKGTSKLLSIKRANP